MERKTICGGLRRLSWSAASARPCFWILPLVLAVCCAWLPFAHAQSAQDAHHAESRAEPVTPDVMDPVDTALSEAGLLDMEMEVQPADGPGETAGPVPVREANNRYEVTPETGLASWYGPGFHRRKTASGERFDMHAMTAAHPTLAFGTLICVRSQITGRGVVVRVNDRGPHARGRIVDLSRAAAIALGLHGLGLKPVEVSPLANGESTCPEE